MAPRRLEVLFVPGVGATTSQFGDVEVSLSREAHDFEGYEYSSFQDPRAIARDLAHFITSRSRGGSRRVLAIGHSLGGLLLSMVLQSERPPEEVVGFVAICSPLHGTRLSRLLPSPSLRTLSPEGPLVTELMATRDRLARLRGRTLTVGARFDAFIAPYDSAFIDGHDQLRLEDTGHVASLFDPRVHTAILALARKLGRVEEEDGTP